MRYYEVLGPGSTNSLIISGITTAGSQPLRTGLKLVRKAVTPTVTKNGTWAVGNCSQPSVSSVDLDGAQLTATSIAAGDTYTFNAGANSNITCEANP
jgi:hypothetical protein